MTPTTDFAELGVSDDVCAALRARGVTSPFPVQQMVLPEALAGDDLLVRSPTGSGKTLAFGLALIERARRVAAGAPSLPRPSGLVLAPTRELAAQIADDLEAPARAGGLRLACCYGGTDLERQARDLPGARIVVATPGRLLDLVSRRMIDLGGISILVLDEADRMLDMGFEPQVRRIVARIPAERQTLLFSATLDGAVAGLADELTRDARSLRLGDARAQGAIDHRFLAVEPSERVDALADALDGQDGLVLVFCRTKRGVDRLVERLAKRGLAALAMHGDLTQKARERALSQIRSGAARVLVATDVAARGIDLDDVAMVVNYDPPAERDSYTHRVGRTARAGRTGVALTLVGADEASEMSRHALALGLTDQWEAAGLAVGAARVLYSSKRRGVLSAPAPRASSRRTVTDPSAPAPRNRIRRGSFRSTVEAPSGA